MASKVEILGGQLDGSVLDNAATESTLRELVDAIKKLESSSNKNAKTAQSSGGGAAGGKGSSPEINTDPADEALKKLGKGAQESGNKLTKGLGQLGMFLGQYGDKIKRVSDSFTDGDKGVSSFLGVLGQLPGPLGAFSSVLASTVGVLEDYQKQQRELAGVGASFNNSMMDLRIAAAQSGLSLDAYAGFVKQNAQDIGGLGSTITEGAQKLSALGKAVGDSGLDTEFMRLGMSAQGAREAAMKFATSLVKGDAVRNASSNELASASLDYEKDLDMLAKQTGKSKDELRKFSDGMIKGGTAVSFAFAKMGPAVQASLKSVIDQVGATMGEGAKDLMEDIMSGAAAPGSAASAMFQAQLPQVAATFKELKRVGEMEANTAEEKAAKAERMDQLKANASYEQLKWLQSEEGKFQAANIKSMSPEQQQFIKGLQANAAALSAQGIDINKASQADIERVNREKRLEQERQKSLDDAMNRFQGLFTNVGSSLQTTFFKLAEGGLNALADGFLALGSILKPVITGIQLVGDEIGMLGTSFMRSMNEFSEILSPVTAAISEAFTYLESVLSPVSETLRDTLYPAFTSISDFIQTNMTPIIGAVVTVLGVMAVTALPAIISGLVAFGVSLVTAAAAILAPFLPVILAVAAVAAGFIYLKNAGWSFGSILEALGDNFKSFFLTLKDGFLNLLDKVTFGDANKKIKEAQADIESERALLKEKEAARDKQRAKVIEERKAVDEKVVAQNADTRAAKQAARDQSDAAKAKKDAIRDAESADAMERSKARAIKDFRERAGIAEARPVAPSPGYGPAAPGGGPAIAGGAGLGKLSEKYEAGNKGSGAVGWDSTGGTSYGKYQIASKTGTMDNFMKFLKTNNPEAYEKLSQAGPADGGKDGAFAKQWQELAKSGGLKDSEHEFIKKTHFDKGVSGVKDKGLQDQIANSKALQEVMWSTSVQHGGGGASGIFNKVAKTGMSEEDIIKAVYAERGTKFGSSTAQVQGSVQKRFADEQKNALAMVGQPGTQTAAAKPPTTGGTVPNGAGVVAATTPVDQAAKDKAAADARTAAAATDPRRTDTQTASAPTTSPATNPITEVIASLNTSLAQLTMLQGKAVSIAEQQLRATNGLSRDAYKAI